MKQGTILFTTVVWQKAERDFLNIFTAFWSIKMDATWTLVGTFRSICWAHQPRIKFD